MRPFRGLKTVRELGGSLTRWLSYGLLVGSATGVIGFLYVQILSKGEIVYRYLRGPWAVVVPTLGGLLVGLLHWLYTREIKYGASEDYVSFYHRARAMINPWAGLWRLMTSVITMLSGGSVGREGPSVFAGGGIGNGIGRLLRLTDRERRILVIGGAGGALGAVFGAPIGGAMYAAEILYSQADMEMDAVLPAILTSVTSYAVFGLLSGWRPMFQTPQYSFAPQDLPFFALLGVIIPLFAWLYVRGIETSRRLFGRLRLPYPLKPALGGLIFGALATFFPQMIGPGYEWCQAALWGKLAVGIMFLIAMLKILGTSLIIGSGGSGGVFGPAAVTGGLLGGALGFLLKRINPILFARPEAFVMVGMGAFLAASFNAPISAIIIISEMTGNYQLLVPMTLAASLAFIVSRRFSILEEAQVPSRMDSPAHRGEMRADILEEISIARVIDRYHPPLAFHPEVPVREALHMTSHVKDLAFPVVDQAGRLIGVLCTEDLRAVVYDGELDQVGGLLLVHDVMRTNIPKLRPSQSLHDAMEALLRSGMPEVPVVDHEGRPIAMISWESVLKAYDQELTRRQSES